MKAKFWSVLSIFFFGYQSVTQGCIWDSKTLSAEKREHPTLAKAILDPELEKPDVPSLTKDIQDLKLNPKTNDPAWWNELAGAYLRLGQPTNAINLLEPVTNRFAGDYGIHANLGTAYHLAGRYADAEREIRRDLEINTNAHFGLEKYHLALLQYLMRDDNYRMRHVYVDEFTDPFVSISTFVRPVLLAGMKSEVENESAGKREQMEADLKNKSGADPAEEYLEYKKLLWSLAVLDEPPQYLSVWNLAQDEKLDDGVIYMATLNPKDPACWVMLGLVAGRHRDSHLAIKAFNKAIQLGSVQTRILQAQIKHIKSRQTFWGIPPNIEDGIYFILAVPIAYYIFRKFHDRKKRRKNATFP